jgi:hypothetical protein
MLIGFPSSWLVSCRFPWMWTVYVDWFFSSSWLESFFSLRWNTWFLLIFYFFLYLWRNVVVVVLMFLFLWCLVEFRGCGVFTLAGSLPSWLEYIFVMMINLSGVF